jgi:hypothetical protein
MNLHQWVLMLTWYELLLGVLFLEVELDAKLVVFLGLLYVIANDEHIGLMNDCSDEGTN